MGLLVGIIWSGGVLAGVKGEGKGLRVVGVVEDRGGGRGGDGRLGQVGWVLCMSLWVSCRS